MHLFTNNIYTFLLLTVSYLKSECENGVFISDEIEDILALMFADDVASFADTVVRLQRQINFINEFKFK